MTQSLLNVKADETLILICEENPQFRPDPLTTGVGSSINNKV
jgi:hypothetical protein